ncbi:MAG: hypothetical protein ACLFTT_07600 [Candidatus Hydrogenedentota bacterium]
MRQTLWYNTFDFGVRASAIALILELALPVRALTVVHLLVLPLSLAGSTTISVLLLAGLLAYALTPFPGNPIWLPAALGLGVVTAAALAGVDRPASETVHGRLAARVPRAMRGLAGLGALLGIVAMAVDDVPLPAAVCWAAACALLWWRMPAVPRKAGSHPFATAALLTVSILVSIGVLEVGARVIGIEMPLLDNRGIAQAHPAAAFTLRRNHVARCAYSTQPGTTDHFTASLSSQGVRGPELAAKANGEFRIFMLGDSYTFGWAVEDDETLPAQLERVLQTRHPNLKWTVINGGVGNYGPWQERIFLHERGFPLEPDLVVHQLFVINDVMNTLWKVGKSLRSYGTDDMRGYLHFKADNEFPRNWDHWLFKHSEAYRLTLHATGESMLVTPFLCNFRAIAEPQVTLPPNEGRPPHIDVCLRQWYPELEEGWALLEDDVLATRADCREREIAYVAYNLPVASTVQDNSWQRIAQSYEEVPYERGKDHRLTYKFFAREGIPHFDVLPALQDAAAPDPLYYPYDGHLTPEGNRYMAEVIAEALLPRLPAQ